MKISYYADGRTLSELEARKITISINGFVDYEISINKTGDLVLNKHQYGDGESEIIIKPSVSNEIRLS